MLRMSRPRRPLRTGEWTEAKAVTFIVTLAATGNVTLAARRSGMSRKSAYALKSRDPAFAAAWAAAAKAGAPAPRQGDKVREVRVPAISPPFGDNRVVNFDAELRDHFFASLAATRLAAASECARKGAYPNQKRT